RRTSTRSRLWVARRSAKWRSGPAWWPTMARPSMLRARCGGHPPASCRFCSSVSVLSRRCSATIERFTIASQARASSASGQSDFFPGMFLRRLGVFIATCAHVGYAPVAPGTFGSAVGLVVYYLVRRQASTAVELGAIALILIVGLWSATEAEHHFGGIDPGPVVIDEVIGMLITLALHPVNVVGA